SLVEAIQRDSVGRGFDAACLEQLASIAAEQRQTIRATRLYAAATALREAISAPQLEPKLREERDSDLAALRTALSEQAFAAAWADGRAMTFAQAVAYALEESADDGHSPVNCPTQLPRRERH